MTTGHAMITSKRHAAYPSELDEETDRRLWTITWRAAGKPVGHWPPTNTH